MIGMVFARLAVYESSMETLTALLPILMYILLGVLVIVLFIGLFSMGRGGIKGSRKSNMMMRYRVGIQAAAVVLLLLMIMLTGR